MNLMHEMKSIKEHFIGVSCSHFTYENIERVWMRMIDIFHTDLIVYECAGGK